MPADGFNRADSNTLGSPPWTEDESTAAALAILGNRLRARSLISNTNNHGFARYEEDIPNAQHVQAIFKAHGPLDGSGLGRARSGLALRLSPTATRASFSGYILVVDFSVNPQDLYLAYLNAESLLNWPNNVILPEFGNSSVALVDGDLVRVEVDSFAFTVKVNGQVLFTTTDTLSLHASGRAGAVVVESTDTVGTEYWSEWDDWQAGSLAPTQVGRDFTHVFDMSSMIGRQFSHPYDARMPALLSPSHPFGIRAPLGLEGAHPFAVLGAGRDWTQRVTVVKSEVDVKRP